MVAFRLFAQGHGVIRAPHRPPVDRDNYIALAQPGLRRVGVLLHLADQCATNIVGDITFASGLGVEIGDFNPIQRV